TADGWERVSRWPSGAKGVGSRLRKSPATVGYFSSQSTPDSLTTGRRSGRPASTPRTHAARGRLDTHPAALALAQLIGTLLALMAFASPSASGQHREPGWLAVFARSFRASVFGC